jgi:hypothetical protein
MRTNAARVQVTREYPAAFEDDFGSSRTKPIKNRHVLRRLDERRTGVAERRNCEPFQPRPRRPPVVFKPCFFSGSVPRLALRATAPHTHWHTCAHDRLRRSHWHRLGARPLASVGGGPVLALMGVRHCGTCHGAHDARSHAFCTRGICTRLFALTCSACRMRLWRRHRKSGAQIVGFYSFMRTLTPGPS